MNYYEDTNHYVLQKFLLVVQLLSFFNEKMHLPTSLSFLLPTVSESGIPLSINQQLVIYVAGDQLPEPDTIKRSTGINCCQHICLINIINLFQWVQGTMFALNVPALES